MIQDFHSPILRGGDSGSLKMEVGGSSKTLLTVYKTA
jgi:hypothetical protein